MNTFGFLHVALEGTILFKLLTAELASRHLPGRPDHQLTLRFFLGSSFSRLFWIFFALLISGSSCLGASISFSADNRRNN